MEDGDTVCKPGAGIGDVDSENKDPDQTCKNIYRQLSGFLFAKRDGAVDTDDFVGQLMKGYYDGCQKGANFLPPPSDDIRIGARIFVENCATCHTVSPGGGLKVGPNLCDMAGRPVASQVDFHHYSPGLRPNGAYAADDKEVTHRGYSRGMLKYVLEQGGWGNLTTGGDTLSEDDFVLKPGGSWTLKHGVTAYLNQERTIDLVNPGEDDLLADKLPRWNKSRFCDFVYDPQGTIPGNAMGKKHVVLSGFERDEWCPKLWAFFKYTRSFTEMSEGDRGSPGAH